jgi:alpha-galactosidase
VFDAAQSWVTCVHGSVEDACERLLSVDVNQVAKQPAIEHDLPIVYNDYCASWGAPTEESILKSAGILAWLGVTYLVIDAGWYMPCTDDAHWAKCIGGWIPDPQRFPNGLKTTADAIRAKGLIPGLWMEPEHVSLSSAAFDQSSHLVHRDGKVLTLELRRAWNLHDPWVKHFLQKRIIEFAQEMGIGYLKLDYAENLGLGIDHPDGLGEGLRHHGEGVHALFDLIRSSLPSVVTELVAAGGGRMEASLLQRTSMASVSDAHETVEIPIIAASLHQLVLPRQCQIWAVLNPGAGEQEMEYRLASTFLGRMCLSGNISALNARELTILKKATAMYKRCVGVIRDGMSTGIMGDFVGESWRHPQGWQGVVRHTAEQVIVVVHGFRKATQRWSVMLPAGQWCVLETLSPTKIDKKGGNVVGHFSGDWQAQVVLLERM